MRDFELILKIALVKGAAISDYPFSLQISGLIRLVILEILHLGVSDRRSGKGVAGVIELDAPDVYARFEVMAAPNHSQVVNEGEGVADLCIKRSSGHIIEAVDADIERSRPDAEVMEVGAIESEFPFVDRAWREAVL